MKKELVTHGINAIADVLSCFGVPTSLATSLIEDFLSKRLKCAQDELIAELRDAKRSSQDVAEQDELISIIYRYLDAARQGAARLNLRLMAKVIKGQYEHDELRADEFLRYADMLSSLTRQEVTFLAILNRHFADAHGEDDTKVYNRVRDEVTGGDKDRALEFFAVAIALQRTGLLLPHYNVIGSGNAFYCKPSPMLRRLSQLASLEDALEQAED